MPNPSVQTPQIKPATASTVAALVVAVSLAGGGYSAGMRAAIAILAWGVVAGGVALGAFPRSRTPGTALVAGGMFLGLTLFTALSVAWASDAGTAIEAAVLASAYLGLFALVVCVAREGDARSWLVGLGIGIAVVGALAILSRLIPGLPGGDEEIARLLPSARGRLSYPIGYWNGTAALLALGVVVMTWLGVSARTVLGRAVAVAIIPMLGLGIYLASSRGGFAALIVGLVVLAALGPKRPQLIAAALIGALGGGLAVALASGQTDLLNATGGSNTDNQGFELLGATLACMFFTGVLRLVFDGPLERLRLSPAAARIALAACAVVLVAVVVAVNPRERFDEFKRVPTNEGVGRTDFIASHLSSGSGSGRWQFWGEALDAFDGEPAHGIGAGGYAYYWNEHAPISRVTKQAHSLYLEVLAELGPLGLLLLLGLLAAPIWRGSWIRNGWPGGEVGVAMALVGAGALSAAIDWVWQIPAVFGVVVLSLALLAGPSLELVEEVRKPPRIPPGWRIGVVGVALVALLLAGDQLLAKRNLDASQAAARDGNLADAADDARAAIALEPWAAAPRAQLALLQESAGDLRGADRSIRAAIDRSPDDWSLWLVRTRIATHEGRLPEARRALAQARRLNPRAPVFNSLTGPLAR
jgi:O-Antigen ligase